MSTETGRGWRFGGFAYTPWGALQDQGDLPLLSIEIGWSQRRNEWGWFRSFHVNLALLGFWVYADVERVPRKAVEWRRRDHD